MKLYNTMTRSVESLQTIEQNKVKLYTCGLTVYSQPHIGNWVAYIYWDVLQRILSHQGYAVERVQNITDVGHLVSDEDDGEDKLQKGANKEGVTAWDIAEKYANIAEREAYKKLGLLRPTHMPKATDYIEQQIEFVKKLETKGFTYQIEDGVYFDTSKLSDYGKLAKLDTDGLRRGARVEDTGKKQPTDFALWKLSPKNQKRDMEWDSPWGKGFPGWHLECSVMAEELLGPHIDIHTGGVDHIPVHHTNEIAQSEALHGEPFSKVWLHANHIKVDGTKISKSLSNGFTLDDVESKGYSTTAFKLMVLSKHYRTEGNFTWEILDASQTRLHSWQATINLEHQLDEHTDANDILEKITAAVSTDLNTSEALACIDTYFNSLLNTHKKAPSKKVVRLIEDLLGIAFDHNDVSEEVKELLQQRQQARDDVDYELSDTLRDDIKKLGYGVSDSPLGQIWYKL